MKHSMQDRIDKILVFRAGTIGDTIIALPVFHALRDAFPKAKLSLVTATGPGRVWTNDVVEGAGIFDDVITYTGKDLRRVSGIIRLLSSIRMTKPEILIYLASDRNCLLRIWRDRLFFRAAGVRNFRYTSSKKVRFYGTFRRDNQIYPYEADRLLESLSGLITGPTRMDFGMAIRHEDELKADSILHRFGPSSKVVAVCPAAKISAKQWPADNYAKLGDKLIREGGVNIALVGAREERHINDSITSNWPQGRWLNLAGELSLSESAAVLKKCTMYVGNDTGAMHLAAAVGTRCLAIFGARAHERSWHPYGRHHVVIRKRVDCANCYLAECTEHQLKCLTGISVDEVWVSCERMLVFD
jgi:heptosyltransferase-3